MQFPSLFSIQIKKYGWWLVVPGFNCLPFNKQNLKNSLNKHLPVDAAETQLPWKTAIDVFQTFIFILLLLSGYLQESIFKQWHPNHHCWRVGRPLKQWVHLVVWLLFMWAQCMSVSTSIHFTSLWRWSFLIGFQWPHPFIDTVETNKCTFTRTWAEWICHLRVFLLTHHSFGDEFSMSVRVGGWRRLSAVNLGSKATDIDPLCKGWKEKSECQGRRRGWGQGRLLIDEVMPV